MYVGVSGSAVTFDQVGLTLKLEGQVIQGGGGGVPEDGDIVVGVAVAEEAPDRGALQVSRGGLTVDLLDTDYTVVEVEGPFDVGDEKVGVPEPSGAKEGGLDLGHPVRSSKEPPRISRNMRRALIYDLSGSCQPSSSPKEKSAAASSGLLPRRKYSLQCFFRALKYR